MSTDSKKTGLLNKQPSLSSMSSSNTTNSEQLNSKFIEQMLKFYAKAEASYNSLDSKFKIAEKDYETACLLYCEEAKTTTPEEFFGVFSKFCQSYLEASKENYMIAQKELQDKKREEAKKIADKQKIDRKSHISLLFPADPPPSSAPSAKATSSAKSGPAVGEGLDDLISSIRTGKAFQDKAGNSNTIKKRGNRRDSISHGTFQPLPDTDSLPKKLNFQNMDQKVVGRLKRIPNPDEKTLNQKLG
jgi:hypothetical protein